MKEAFEQIVHQNEVLTKQLSSTKETLEKKSKQLDEAIAN